MPLPLARWLGPEPTGQQEGQREQREQKEGPEPTGQQEEERRAEQLEGKLEGQLEQRQERERQEPRRELSGREQRWGGNLPQ